MNAIVKQKAEERNSIYNKHEKEKTDLVHCR